MVLLKDQNKRISKPHSNSLIQIVRTLLLVKRLCGCDLFDDDKTFSYQKHMFERDFNYYNTVLNFANKM